MRVLSEVDAKYVSGGVSMFHPILFVGQMIVWGATAYLTITHIKGNFMSYPGSSAIVGLFTTELVGAPIGALGMGGLSAWGGYKLYYVIAAI